MSRFSPSVPKSVEDPGTRSATPKAVHIFKRTGSTVLTVGGSDPGAHLPAVDKEVQFRRTGEQIGPSIKKKTSPTDFEGFSSEADDKARLENLSKKKTSMELIETKPRSNSGEGKIESRLSTTEKLIEKEEIEETRERSSSIPQPMPSLERKLAIGSFSSKGRRKKNEDAHVALLTLPNDDHTAFFAVFDGHGGKNASHFCQKKMHKIISSQKTYQSDKRQALIDGFLETDRKFIDKLYNDGTTAVVALLCEGNKLYVANVGDSRCILVRKDKTVVQMSFDHKPENEVEKSRIEASGHEVTKDQSRVNGKKIVVYRVDHELGVARSIGDVNFKDNSDLPQEKQAVTCFPDIVEDKVEQGDMLVLACDGLWDVMSNEQVRDYIFDNLPNSNAQQMTESLVDHAYNLGSEDNISVVFVKLE